MSDISESALQKQVSELQKKLSVAEEWMKREVTKQSSCIREEKLSISVGEDFEKKISEKILGFFSNTTFISLEGEIIENLITSEVELRLLELGYQIDSLSVILSYQKILDFWIEKYITSGFRNFARKLGKIDFHDHHHLENIFDNIMDQNYILGVNKFFSSILLIKSGENLPSGVKCFHEYLLSQQDMYTVLFSEEFLDISSSLLQMDIFGSKRHSGEIPLQELQRIRSLVTGNLSNSNCLFYKLFETQAIGI